jgi:hypothetical protein
MTQITYERTGGFMGRKVSFSLNLDELPARQSRSLKRLLDEADFFALPENSIPAPLPDAFIYTITVEEETVIRTVQINEETTPEALRPLLEDLSRLARSAQKKKKR